MSIVCLLIRPHFSGIADFNENLINSLDIDSIIHPSDELAQEIVQIADIQGALDVQVFEQSQVYLVKVRVEEQSLQ